jgi:hypothetical protein
MQKLAWKAKNTSCGIVVPSRGANVTSCRNAWPNPPTIPLPSLKASE